MATYRTQKEKPSRLNAAAFKVAGFAESRWVIFTQKFILVVVGVIVVVDLFLAMNDVRGDTISEVLKAWAYQRFFVLAWAWGVLAGHLFVTRESALLSAPWNIWLLLGLTAALLAVGLGYKPLVPVPAQVVLLLAGAAAGHYLWPQVPVQP